MDLRMAVYAAMIDCIDQNVGKLLHVLKKREQFENTMILFLTDNACAEVLFSGVEKFMILLNATSRPIIIMEQPGLIFPVRPFVSTSTSPTRVVLPLLSSCTGPCGIKSQKDWYRSPAQIIDVFPTLLEVCGVITLKVFMAIRFPALRGNLSPPFFAGKSLWR